MEKLLIRTLICFCFIQTISAQDSLCVFGTKGTVFKQLYSKKIPLGKGDIISIKDKLTVLPNSQLTALGKVGDLYVISKQGTYSFKNILQFKQEKAAKNVTSLYLKYLWNELTHKNEKKALVGGVFRGAVLMKSPKDSTIIANSKVTLEWRSNGIDSLYYVFIKNKKTNSVFKFETNGSHLVFEKENPIFEGSTEFEWFVTTEAFPNINNIPFYTFTKLNYEDYEKLKNSYQDLVTDLRAFGYNEDEIKNILCSQYKLCN